MNNFTQGLYKYDQDIYDMFMDSFDMFPICAIVNGKFIALHGGLSPLLTTVNNSQEDQ
jgi:serine/threonine-protein phosphatase 2B catalytic subunit